MMKTLLIITIFFAPSLLFARSATDSLRKFHYTWGYWNENNGNSGWGENDISLNHFPTKKEILTKHVYTLNKHLRYEKVDLTIYEITPLQDSTGYYYKRTTSERIPFVIKRHLPK